jgi:hypothetical protein
LQMFIERKQPDWSSQVAGEWTTTAATGARTVVNFDAHTHLVEGARAHMWRE